VRTSDVNLTVAIEVLTTMQAGADPVQVAARQVQVDTAEVALATAREKLAQMKAGPVVLEVDVRAAQVATGEATLAAAQDSLALMRAGGDALTVQAKVAAVRLAEETLSQAESDLAEARKGVGAADLGVLEANVATARFNLDTAKDRSANADIRAPIAGTVTAVGLASGQNASTTTAAFEIADTTALELVGSIQEVDVLSVREGSAATVTLDALPGEALQGRVVSIATTGNSSQGVVTYPVRISLEAAGGVVLRDGLSATATIVVEKQENVLLVPVQALVGTFDQPQIRVLQAGTPVVRPVSLGNTDGYWVAVLSGLAEGDRVVMDSLRATTSGQLGVRPGQALGGLGGGTFTVNTGPGAGGRGQTGGGGNR
jgi:RND family efflux transporter MFP subunit